MRTKPSTTPVSVTRAWRFGHWTRCSSAQTAIRNCMTRGRSLCACVFPAAPTPHLVPGFTRPGRGFGLLVLELPVVDLVQRLVLVERRLGLERAFVLVERRLVVDDRVRAALVDRRCADGQVGGNGRRGIDGRRVVDQRRVAVALVGETARAPLGLPLLGPLTVTCHARGRARLSAGLLVRRVPAAPTAVLAELDPVGMVALGLLGLVVAPLALLAREGDGDSNVS